MQLSEEPSYRLPNLFWVGGNNLNILVEKISRFVNGEFGNKFLLLALFAVLIYIPLRVILPFRFVFDSFVILFIVAIYKKFVSMGLGVGFLELLGKHSFNIFLFHTFIYSIYFPNLIYWSKNPVLIYLTLLSACLIISVILDNIKRLIGLNNW
jgi:peptidoglycan/LPS O-acetylase OafA/YrhL